MKKILYICILATSTYKEYLKFFIKSLPNLKLKNFNTKLIIISDKKQYDEYLYYPISHFPYPFNSYLKPYIVKNALEYYNCHDDDYMMYVDADTIIRKCDNFDYFENCLLTNKMIFSISPWSHQYNYGYENNLCKNNYPEVYINNFQPEDFIQASFFSGNIKAYNNFCQLCFDLTLEFTKDWKNKRIPPMFDQSIITKIIYDNKELYIKDDFIVSTLDHYTIEDSNNIILKDMYLYNSFITKDYPYIFLIQKFNGEFKKNIRYGINV